MLRKKLTNTKREKKDRIKWRSHEVTRIEAFSDAVIAFSVTLLIVALEVPESFDDLMHNMAGFIPFALCFLLLFYIWKTQHIFFRRYNLHDERTYNLNGILLFVLLFFVYPLKFLSVNIMNSFSGHHENLNAGQMAKLMCIYSGGYTAIFTLFALMYQNALRQKEKIQLTEPEIFETKTDLYMHCIMASFGILSMLMALSNPYLLVCSGFIYAFVGIPITILHSKRGKKYRSLYGTEVPAPVL